MSAKHTPGPWEFVQAGSGNFPTWNVRIGTRGLITLPATASMETMDADARLIAAAPDLLVAIKALHDATICLDVTNCESGLVSEAESALAQARAAIAKAEGTE